MNRHRRCEIDVRLIVAVCVGAMSPYAYAQETPEPLDCVINPRTTAALGSPEQGILEEMLVTRGARVQKGDVVARIQNEIEELTAEVARVRAQSDVSIRSAKLQSQYRDRELRRLEELRGNDVVPENLYDEARIESELALLSVEDAAVNLELARVEHQRANAALQRTLIRSPFDGIVVDVLQAPGEYVHEQSELMRLAEIDPLHVEVFMPVDAYGAIQEGATAVVRPEQPIGGEYTATVVVVDQVFDAASRTFGIRLELANENYKLPAGLRCTVEFEGSSPP